jgi:hypothetical protein
LGVFISIGALDRSHMRESRITDRVRWGLSVAWEREFGWALVSSIGEP